MAGLKWTAIAAVALPLVAAITPEYVFKSCDMMKLTQSNRLMLAAPRRSELHPNPSGVSRYIGAEDDADHNRNGASSLPRTTLGKITEPLQCGI